MYLLFIYLYKLNKDTVSLFLFNLMDYLTVYCAMLGVLDISLPLTIVKLSSLLLAFIFPLLFISFHCCLVVNLYIYMHISLYQEVKKCCFTPSIIVESEDKFLYALELL